MGTGFINYEPIFPTEPVRKHADASNSSSGVSPNDYPDSQQQTYHPSSHKFAHSHGKWRFTLPYERHRKERRRRWRRRVAWVLSVAAGTAVSTAYVGLARSDKHA